MLQFVIIIELFKNNFCYFYWNHPAGASAEESTKFCLIISFSLGLFRFKYYKIWSRSVLSCRVLHVDTSWWRDQSGVQPLTCLYTRHPSRIRSFDNGTPFVYKAFRSEHCIPFNCCKCIVFLIWINHFITSTLKSLAICAIWLALSGVIYS